MRVLINVNFAICPQIAKLIMCIIKLIAKKIVWLENEIFYYNNTNTPKARALTPSRHYSHCLMNRAGSLNRIIKTSQSNVSLRYIVYMYLPADLHMGHFPATFTPDSPPCLAHPGLLLQALLPSPQFPGPLHTGRQWAQSIQPPSPDRRWRRTDVGCLLQQRCSANSGFCPTICSGTPNLH